MKDVKSFLSMVTIIFIVVTSLSLMIYMEKLLSSDWLREMQFSGNSMQKRVNSVQKRVNSVQRK